MLFTGLDILPVYDDVLVLGYDFLAQIVKFCWSFINELVCGAFKMAEIIYLSQLVLIQTILIKLILGFWEELVNVISFILNVFKQFLFVLFKFGHGGQFLFKGILLLGQSVDFLIGWKIFVISFLFSWNDFLLLGNGIKFIVYFLFVLLKPLDACDGLFKVYVNLKFGNELFQSVDFLFGFANLVQFLLNPMFFLLQFGQGLFFHFQIVLLGFIDFLFPLHCAFAFGNLLDEAVNFIDLLLQLMASVLKAFEFILFLLIVFHQFIWIV